MGVLLVFLIQGFTSCSHPQPCCPHFIFSNSRVASRPLYISSSFRGQGRVLGVRRRSASSTCSARGAGRRCSWRTTWGPTASSTRCWCRSTRSRSRTPRAPPPRLGREEKWGGPRFLAGFFLPRLGGGRGVCLGSVFVWCVWSLGGLVGGCPFLVFEGGGVTRVEEVSCWFCWVSRATGKWESRESRPRARTWNEKRRIRPPA